MRIVFVWTIWALPLGISIGGKGDEFRWAITVGPINFVRTNRAHAALTKESHDDE